MHLSHRSGAARKPYGAAFAEPLPARCCIGGIQRSLRCSLIKPVFIMKRSDVNSPFFRSAVSGKADNRMIACKSKRLFADRFIFQVETDNVIERLSGRKLF